VLRLAIPLLHVSSAQAAEKFYCDRLGFCLEFSHRADSARPDPCYSGIARDGVWLHLSSFCGDGVSGGVANLLTDDVDALHAEFLAKGVEIDPAHPVNQTWGTGEMYVRDPDGDTLRFIQDLS
jgi:catechol 2,3-dioxygenase-like lactoylglutathione lyase family enzyme